MRSRLPLVMAGWLVTGALATGAGVAAVTFLGEPLTASAHRPLSSAEVEEALARALPPETVPSAAAGPDAAVPSGGAGPEPGSTSAPETGSTPSDTSSAPVTGSTPSGTPSATPVGDASAPPATGPGNGRSRAITTAGGNVIARCDGGLVVLRAWSPAQGFQVDDVERGPAARARVEFESDEADVKVEVRCGAGGLPAHRVHD
ncbi:hypothetical protein Ppa06_30240 [Planomonospora parontospora subsp. parontospora]|uniref:Septum formation initiator n=2 Tax=Planomonospora parontospora TaxID=58119 RepID=A0AA37BHI9_9ACTN|nr:hypothetical protein [Planomonospora parontospora]GGK72024.1 hypothetical protein GCM10010126_34330 [Planomonospora parontospora]GII09226.1 hypothetical protein Ppa06_30240 [Planomonospora parontospora subsp. parontospora]